MVGNQIFNLILIFSFNCNSCILGLNKQCKCTLNIYTLKPFQWCLGGPNWCLCALWTKGLNIWDSRTNATPKVKVHLGIIGVHSLAPSPTCESLFHSRAHFFGLMCSCIPHLVANSISRFQQDAWSLWSCMSRRWWFRPHFGHLMIMSYMIKRSEHGKVDLKIHLLKSKNFNMTIFNINIRKYIQNFLKVSLWKPPCFYWILMSWMQNLKNFSIIKIGNK